MKPRHAIAKGNDFTPKEKVRRAVRGIRVRMPGSRISVLLLLAVCVLCDKSRAQTGGEYDLSWYSVDGGSGWAQGTDGRFILSMGVLGQPDAGHLGGTTYTLEQAGFILPGFQTAALYGISGLPDPERYLAGTTHTLTIRGPQRAEIKVWARIKGDSDGPEFLIAVDSIDNGTTCATMVLGGNTSDVGPLPEEDILSMRVEWWLGERLAMSRLLGDQKVDVVPPRFVHALAPAGDFYAMLPDPATVHDLGIPIVKPEDSTMNEVDFFSSDSFDYGSDPEEGSSGIQYRIRLWREDENGVPYSEGFVQNWPASEVTCNNTPVAKAVISATAENIEHPTTPTVKRGYFPRNVYSRSGTNAKTRLGNGQYFWVVEAKDKAGNISMSDVCELWIPPVNESLWCNVYSDDDARFRAIIWMPRDHLVPSYNASGGTIFYNGEWSPYSDHPLRDDIDALKNAFESWSPTVVSGDTVGKRNQSYAEYIWIHARRWLYAIESMTECYEKQAHFPGGAAYAPYYPEPLLGSNYDLKPGYSSLRDGRLRLEIYRDPKITEKILYNQYDAVQDGIIQVQDQFENVHRVIWRTLDGTQWLLRRNVLLMAQDWSGFAWRWYSPGIQVNVEGTRFAKTYIRNFYKDEPQAFSEMALQWEGGAGAYGRTKGAGGTFGSSWIHCISLPDWLEAYLPMKDRENELFSPVINASQNYLRSHALVKRKTADTDSGSITFSAVQRGLEMMERIDRRNPKGSDYPIKGNPSGRWWMTNPGLSEEEFQTIEMMRTELNGTGDTWSKTESAYCGHPIHEAAHALSIGHDSFIVRGPNTGERDWILGAGFTYYFGTMQLGGLDPTRAGASSCDWLLALPSIDAALSIDGGGGSPSVGWAIPRPMHPATLAVALPHPVLNRNKSGLNGLSDETDPIGRVAWPRDGAYLRMKDIPGTTISDFPPVFIMAEDKGPNASGLFHSVVVLAENHDPGHYGLVEYDHGTTVPWSGPEPFNSLGPDARLFMHDANSFGYADTQGDPRKPKYDDAVYVFRYPGACVALAQISDRAGNMGDNGQDTITVFYDHHDTTTVPRHRLVYVASGHPAGTTGGTGSMASPFCSIDHAIARKLVEGGAWTIALLPGDHETSGVTQNVYSEWKFVGAGDDPASVALRLAAGEGPALFQLDSGSSRAFNVSISNMTLADAPTAIHVRYCHGVHLSNLVIRDMSEYGIRVNEVCEGGLFVVNNTLVNCRRGITVEKVHGDMAKQFGDTRHFRSSAVENNIIYEYTDYGIRIGQSTGTYEQQAQAWNPFADNHPYGEPNPIVPVKYNCVWNSTGQGTPFEGTTWYKTLYNAATPISRHGEVLANPLLDTNNGYRPAVESDGQGGYRRLNNVWRENDPILGKGNPYRIDAVKTGDNYYGMRRSMGAYEVRDTQLLWDYYYQTPLD